MVWTVRPYLHNTHHLDASPLVSTSHGSVSDLNSQLSIDLLLYRNACTKPSCLSLLSQLCPSSEVIVRRKVEGWEAPGPRNRLPACLPAPGVWSPRGRCRNIYLHLFIYLFIYSPPSKSSSFCQPQYASVLRHGSMTDMQAGWPSQRRGLSRQHWRNAIEMTPLNALSCGTLYLRRVTSYYIWCVDFLHCLLM